MLDAIFSIAGAAVMAGWAGLILLPRVPFVVRVLARLVIPLGIALTYASLMAVYWGQAPAAAGFDSLAAVGELFTVPGLLLAGWIHYLAFDLFVGSWEVENAQAHEVPHLLLVPCLIATFIAGPAGFALYLLLRLIVDRLRARRLLQPPSTAETAS